MPHLAWPLHREGTSLATVEQDSVQEVAQCVAILLSTEVGTFLHQPEFGITDPLFDRIPVDLEPLDQAAADFEDRAVLTFTDDTDNATLALGEDQVGVLVDVNT
jgi:hypothetical protein